MPLFQFCFEKLEAANTIPKVFLVLKDYFSFFNYHIIEHIIEELGTEEDKTRLQGYKEYFNWYAKRRIFECLPEFGPVCDTDHADIFVKVDSQYDNYTVAEMEVFCHKLNEILRVSSQGILRLCQVVEGCFQLTFQVPSFVQQEIFPLSREQEQKLEAKGVIELTCEDYYFQVCNNEEDSAEKPQRGIDTSGEFVHVATCIKANQLLSQLNQFDTEISKLNLSVSLHHIMTLQYCFSHHCFCLFSFFLLLLSFS